MPRTRPGIRDRLGGNAHPLGSDPGFRQSDQSDSDRGARSLSSTLSQASRYGTPLGKALRVLSKEMRAVQQMRMEERAARLPVLITLPMICFILPCVFIVVGGPAFMEVAKTFQN